MTSDPSQQDDILAPVLDRNIRALVARRRARMGLEQSADPELPELERDVRPERVLDHLERVSGDRAPDHQREPP